MNFNLMFYIFCNFINIYFCCKRKFINCFFLFKMSIILFEGNADLIIFQGIAVCIVICFIFSVGVGVLGVTDEKRNGCLEWCGRSFTYNNEFYLISKFFAFIKCLHIHVMKTVVWTKIDESGKINQYGFYSSQYTFVNNTLVTIEIKTRFFFFFVYLFYLFILLIKLQCW
jgi:hypothetical protein